MVQSDKAYYLRNLELALLLSIKGMKELYGIRMDNVQNPDQSLIYQALFELEKKRFICIDKGNVMIYPELDQMLDDIKNAERMLLYVNRCTEYPDQCIYLGINAVFISAYGTTGDMKRIESITLNLLPEKICEYGFHLEEMVGDQGLLKKAEIENLELKEQTEALFNREFNKLEEDEWGNITDSLKVLSLKNRKYVKQYLLIKDKIYDYFSITDEQLSHIYVYSRKKVIDVLKNDLVM